jgi:glutamate decarboxylase
MGVTYTGMYEPVEEIAKALDVIQKETGFDVPIHIDAASGGFITPFLQPTLNWDFEIERVHSISVSGHKYGLTYPGLGWVVWREAKYLPDDLIFKVSYLGGEMPTFALNFSRPGAQVLLQYYNFLRLGRTGYTEVQQASHDVARHLATAIAAMEPFELWNDAQDIPVFAWRLKKGHSKNWDLFDLSNQLRESGWLVPAYPMPDDLADIIVQRIVVRNGFSMSLADRFLDQFAKSVTFLDELDGPVPHEHRVTETFHH